MPFSPVNPIDSPYDQFVFNYTHPKKSMLPSDASHAGQDDLTEARTDVRSIMSPYGSKVLLLKSFCGCMVQTDQHAGYWRMTVYSQICWKIRSTGNRKQ
ncbi:hypothetical protein AVEN_113173-1 [Araneus ventricosus]|uniref:Uncharacterized protein n=1 Tax=Araneus ventricosus TaxID=182803 RepID=A0A4Y2I1Z7_ARAVE|nr:hypothetical protein AVEN_113173-1 [Araneus ventricosus]